MTVERVVLWGVVIDCADPVALAEFWASFTGYEVAHQDDAWVSLRSPDGGDRISFQKVPEPKTVKNRVHIDWRSDDRVAEVARLRGLGATEIATRSLGDFTWTVMADPEGNEFCVS